MVARRLGSFPSERTCRVSNAHVPKLLFDKTAQNLLILQFLFKLWLFSKTPVCSFARDAITKYHRLGNLNDGIYFYIVLEAGSPRPRLVLRPLSLAWG